MEHELARRDAERDERQVDELRRERRQAQTIFLLNRFLNRVGPDARKVSKRQIRMFALARRALADPRLEVDPLFERSPYTSTLLTRAICLVRAVRAAALQKPPNLAAAAMEDWAVRPGWSDYRLLPGRPYPPLNSRADLNMTADLTMSGSLFKVWENHRLTRSPGRSGSCSPGCWRVGGDATPFEETFFLRGD